MLERETTEAKENVEVLKESLAKQQSLTEKGNIFQTLLWSSVKIWGNDEDTDTW